MIKPQANLYKVYLYNIGVLALFTEIKVILILEALGSAFPAEVAALRSVAPELLCQEKNIFSKNKKIGF